MLRLSWVRIYRSFYFYWAPIASVASGLVRAEGAENAFLADVRWSATLREAEKSKRREGDTMLKMQEMKNKLGGRGAYAPGHPHKERANGGETNYHSARTSTMSTREVLQKFVAKD
jgi:hypothetical protein